MVTPITTPSTTSTPSLVFSSSKAGTVTFGGACTSISTVAVFGNNIVVLNSLPAGTYSNCTITVTDATNNASNVLTIPTFTISSATSVNPSVPTNLLPNNTSISANGWDFSWNPSTGTGPLTYQVITSMTPTLNASGELTTGTFSSGSLSATSVFFNGATPGIWYWQVRAQDSLGNFSAWSPLASVTKTTTVPTGPSVPTNLLPNNTSISANSWNFSWNAATGTGPLTYEVKTSLNPTVDGT